MIKCTVFYSGSRNSKVENDIIMLAEACNGRKAGDWGFGEGGLSCLFLFKKEPQAKDFELKCRQKISHRVIVNIGR